MKNSGNVEKKQEAEGVFVKGVLEMLESELPGTRFEEVKKKLEKGRAELGQTSEEFYRVMGPILFSCFDCELEQEPAAAKDEGLNPCLAVVRRYLATMSYKEKLAIALCSELVGNEHIFKDGVMCSNAYPNDKEIGNTLLRDCLNEVVSKSNDPDYLKEADKLEGMITGFVMGLIPVST